MPDSSMESENGSSPAWYTPGCLLAKEQRPDWQCPTCLRHGLFVRAYYVSPTEADLARASFTHSCHIAGKRDRLTAPPHALGEECPVRNANAFSPPTIGNSLNVAIAQA